MGSEVIDFEISKIPEEERRKKVKLLTRKIAEKQKLTEKVIQRAKLIEEKGIKSIGSLHIASAEFLESDYMITTDNKIINKYQKYREFFEKIKIYNPISFLTEEL